MQEKKADLVVLGGGHVGIVQRFGLQIWAGR